MDPFCHVLERGSKSPKHKNQKKTKQNKIRKPNTGPCQVWLRASLVRWCRFASCQQEWGKQGVQDLNTLFIPKTGSSQVSWGSSKRQETKRQGTASDRVWEALEKHVQLQSISTESCIFHWAVVLTPGKWIQVHQRWVRSPTEVGAAIVHTLIKLF